MRAEFEAGSDADKNGAFIFQQAKQKDFRLTIGPGDYHVPAFDWIAGVGLDFQGQSGEARPNIILGKSVSGWCGLELNHNVYLRHLSLSAPFGPGVQSQVLGFQRPPYVVGKNNTGCLPGSHIILDDCIFSGGAFALECWTCQGAIIDAYRCQFSGAWAVCAGGSSGPNAQTINLYDCRMLVDRLSYPSADASQGNQFGGFAPQVAGVVARGGRVNVYGGGISVRGAPGVRTFAALTTTAGETPADPAKHPRPDWPFVGLHDVTINVEPCGATVFGEVDPQVGTIERCP